MNPRSSSGTVAMISGTEPRQRQVDAELAMTAIATKSCPGLSSQVSRTSLDGVRLAFIVWQALPEAPPKQTYTLPSIQRQFVAPTATTSDRKSTRLNSSH